jgi:hypothetical protein
MKPIHRPAFWIAILLGVIVAQCSTAGAQKKKEPLPERLTEVQFSGCTITAAIVAGEPGWHVSVWADYEKKPKGAEHDWARWYSFRKGRKGDARAWKDCTEWRKALNAAREKAKRDLQISESSKGTGDYNDDPSTNN